MVRDSGGSLMVSPCTMLKVDGCSATVRLERDHRIEWRVTRHTRLDELDRLCHTHHDMKTKGKQVVPP